MGGRGSSGSSGGGSGSASSAKMPALTGSEKQIAWANEIRAGFLNAADANVRNAQRDRSLGTAVKGYEGTAISVEAAKQVRKDAVKMMQGVTSAKQIIENRGRLTQDFLTRAGNAWDRGKMRGK